MLSKFFLLRGDMDGLDIAIRKLQELNRKMEGVAQVTKNTNDILDRMDKSHREWYDKIKKELGE